MCIFSYFTFFKLLNLETNSGFERFRWQLQEGHCRKQAGAILTHQFL